MNVSNYLYCHVRPEGLCDVERDLLAIAVF